ncbi:MAG: SRPBCC domain-containing protein [Planctomycetota bacterium]
MTTEARFEDGRLIVTRTYNAPRELVFEAWVETSKVQQWWGCAQCTNVRSEIEPKVGGKYNHHMTIEGAGEVPVFATLIEYEPPSKISYETSLPDNENIKMSVHIEFFETPEGTLIRLEHIGIPDFRVDGEIELRSIVREGWTTAFEKLEKFLGRELSM